MTKEEISNKPVFTSDDKSKGAEKSKSTKKQPTLPSDKNPKTEDGQGNKQKNQQKDKDQHEHDFDAIYKILHAKFPNIINMDKPVLLAVGIRRKMLKHLEDHKDITNPVLNKWIKWYFRKSKYYSIHQVGAVRYNLDGTNAGTVTEKDQAKRDKQMQQIKKSSLEQRSIEREKNKNQKPDVSNPDNAETKSH